MEGEVLGVEWKNNRVAVKGSNGSRFYFPLSEWHGGAPPSAGMQVDFEPASSNTAKNVFPIQQPGLATLFNGKSGSSRVTATVLAFLLGMFGAHKFYVGSWGLGIVYFLFFWTQIPFLLSIIEGIRYLSLSDAEFLQKRNSLNGPFAFLW